MIVIGPGRSQAPEAVIGLIKHETRPVCDHKPRERLAHDDKPGGAPPRKLGFKKKFGGGKKFGKGGYKGKKPKPASWADLTKPDYKDQIVMPNPASSGTGYLTVAAWLQAMGEDAGWKFMDALHQNIAQYIHSGSAPCVQAAKGERLIGIGLDTRGASEKSKGAPIELILPKEGLGSEIEVTAIVKGTKNLAAAKKLAGAAKASHMKKCVADAVGT